MTTTVDRGRGVDEPTRRSGNLLTRRERAVLAAVERRLTNPQIAAEMFVSVRTVESHIGSLRRKLGADSRTALIAAASAAHGEAFDLPHNPLRGRNAELDDVQELLDSRRWATITGPVGVGKTRLALEAARRTERTPIVVELENATAEEVVARIAQVLAIHGATGDLVPAIAAALATRPYLLVLDNVDRAREAVGVVVERLCAVAVNLRVLTTSRSPLDHPGESVLALRPLRSSGPDSPAAALLLDRLGEADRPIRLAERAAVDRIAERLDGLPLALELAASVARHCSLAELIARPTTTLTALETAFGWSWDLLSDSERDVLRSLAALPRTFDLELAAAVTNDRVRSTVLRLLDRSLLVERADDPGRFTMLAVVRVFVRARTEPARIRAVREEHAIQLAIIGTDFIDTARADDSTRTQARFLAVRPELVVALRWALAADHPTAPTLAALVGIALEQFGSDRGSIIALVSAARSDYVRSTAGAVELLALGAAIAPFEPELVAELAQIAMRSVPTATDRLAALHLAGIADTFGGRAHDALALLDEAEYVAIELGNVWEAAAISRLQGIALASGGGRNVPAALGALESATRRFARAGDRSRLNNCRYLMAQIVADNGIRMDRAGEWSNDATRFARLTAERREAGRVHRGRAIDA